jgi:hypothetical protein
VGYVRPYTDSFIIPNPLFLVPARSSVSLISLALSQTATWNEPATVAYQNGLTFEIAAHKDGAGRLLGTVVYEDKNSELEPAAGARVVVAGKYGRWETRTGNDGTFVLVLPAGDYSVYAQGDPRFVQVQPVVGYVRPYTDSLIVPDILYLVSRRE